MFKSLPANQRRGFIWELVDLEPGIPIGRLAELVPFASSSCRGVICRLELSKASVEKVGKMNAPVSVGPPADPYTTYDLLKQEAGILKALRVLPSVLLHDVPLSLAPVGGLAGATHCTVID